MLVFVLTETCVICSRSMACGPLPPLTLTELSVTLSSLPVTTLDSANVIRTSVPERSAVTLLQSASNWAVAVAAVRRTDTILLRRNHSPIWRDGSNLGIME